MGKKINKTACSFLLVLKYILGNNIFKIDDVLNYLELQHNIFVYRETILKYFRTFKRAGFKFKKIDNKNYQLIYIPFAFNITNEEKQVLSSLNANELVIDKSLDSTFEKIKIIIPEVVSHLDSLKNQDDKYKKFKKYCKEKLRLKITYSKSNTVINSLVEPYGVTFLENTLKLKVYNITNKEHSYIDINNILKASQTPIKNKYEFQEKQAIIKFTDKLAKIYNLKEKEEIIRKDGDSIYVSSYYYDTQYFFNNILRYMGKCEIVSPQKLREDFKSYTEKLYEMYDCN